MAENGEARQVSIEDVLNFGDKLMQAWGSSLYAVILKIGTAQKIAPYGRWLNLPHAYAGSRLRTSQSPSNAFRKAIELMLGIEDPRGAPALQKTPRAFPEGSRLVSCELGGGVSCGDRIVALSGQAAEHDTLIAALMLWMWAAGSMRCEPYAREKQGIQIVDVHVSNPPALLGFLSQVCPTSSLLPSQMLFVVGTDDARDLGHRIGVSIQKF